MNPPVSQQTKSPEDLQQKLLDRNKAHRDAVANRLQSSIFDGLVTKYEREKNVLPEHIFVRDFLPYFCGEKDISKNEEVIPMWCAVAGNPSNEVTILSPEGQALFDVPAIMDTSAFNPAYNHRRGGRDISIDDISNQADLLSQTLPERGTRYFDEAFYHRVEMLKNKNFDNTEYSKRWQAIFERYGKTAKTEAVTGSSTPAAPAVKSQITDDDLEF